VQNEDNTGKHTDNPDGLHATPSRLITAAISAIPTIFTPDALPDTTLPIYPWFGAKPEEYSRVSQKVSRPNTQEMPFEIGRCVNVKYAHSTELVYQYNTA